MSCGRYTSNKTPKDLDTYWTLESTPNNLDEVGVIFAVGPNKEVIRIPNGNLNLQKQSGSAALTHGKKTKILSIQAIADFLAIKNIDSVSQLSVTLKDTASIISTFIVENPILTIASDDLKKAFDQKKSVIENNMDFLSIKDFKLFLILETIKSNKVNISFNKTNKLVTSANLKLSQTLDVRPNFNLTALNDKSLLYDLKESLTVFYHLIPINVNFVTERSENKTITKARLSIGKSIDNQQELR